MDGIRVVTEVIVGELPQPFQLSVDGGGAGEVGVEGGLLGVHRWLRVVIDDATMNALFDQEAKHFSNTSRWWKLLGLAASTMERSSMLVRSHIAGS